MRSIRLILTNNVKDTTCEEKNLEIYKFDKNEFTEEELKKIVININKSKSKSVTLITNKENLFEFFNRKIISIEKKSFILNVKGLISNDEKDENIKKDEIDIHLSLNCNTTLEFKIFFSNNIKNILCNYGAIFKIDIEKLVKGTTYKVNDIDELINLIDEDLNLIVFKEIITSRLCIIFYRLTYFDLKISKASVGRFFANYFGKSESFKINLNRNSDNCFFTDLNNKIFRGYRIKPKTYKSLDLIFELKITIAKNLLKKKVKIEIIAEALDMTIEELNDRIFGTKKDNTINN